MRSAPLAAAREGSPAAAPDLNELALRAAQGDSEALERVCRAVQEPVYRLALRFFGSPDDAEDCTQEILTQVVTSLGSFEGRSRLTTWVYRIASRHLLRTRKRRVETSVQGPERFAQWLDTHVAESPYTAASEAELRILCNEVRIGCTYGMLLCLSRELRIAYILGDLLEMTHREGAEALEISPAAFRQRLKRARDTVRPVIALRCGLVDPRGSCSCDRQVQSSIDHGLIPGGEPIYAKLPCARPGVSPIDADRFQRAADQLDVAERLAAVFRNDPEFLSPARVMEELQAACPDLLGSP